MSKPIFHNDFNFIESINANEQLRINKITKTSTYVCIMFLALGLILIIHIFVFDIIGLYEFMLLLFFDILAMIVNIKYLIFDTQIIGLAYGIVKCKECKEKIMINHDDRKVCSWYEENDYKNNQKPVLSSIKTFYYIDVIFCNIEGEMKHISVFEKDFHIMEKGDRVIVIRLKNNNVISILAEKTNL